MIQLPHSSELTALLLLALFALVPNPASAQTVLENGDVFDSIQYTSAITYDGNAKLKDETAYSSTILWKSCTTSAFVTVDATYDFIKPFPTSLYYKLESTQFFFGGGFAFVELPPNAYIHAVRNMATGTEHTIFSVSITVETNNITTLIDDSEINGNLGERDIPYVSLKVPIGSPYIVTHMRNARIKSTYAVFTTTTCSDGSTIFLEKVSCTRCSGDMVDLKLLDSIKRNSALILKSVESITPRELGINAVFIMKEGVTIEIDTNSVLAMIDVDVMNNFNGRSIEKIFNNAVFTGDGTIVMLRVKMSSSGIHSTQKQPPDNTNFWVVAMATPERVMTFDELRGQNLNVNPNNVISWDGTGADGKCVRVGLALPNTATYELVNGKCEATCPQGNYLPPACTPRAVCSGVPNCEACYAHPKDKCLECLPHTTPDNNDTKCTCPIRECVTCPSATLCTNCTKDYKYSADHNACFHCTIDKCAVCREDDTCSACEGGYTLYNNECILCNLRNCSVCSSTSKCAICECGFVPSDDSSECVPCAVSECKYCDYTGNGKKCDICIDGYVRTDDGACKKAPLASWIVLIIVIACMVLVGVAVSVSVWAYRRYQAKKLEEMKDAEERRRNRQTVRGTRAPLVMSAVDLGDLEAAANGVRDNMDSAP